MTTRYSRCPRCRRRRRFEVHVTPALFQVWVCSRRHRFQFKLSTTQRASLALRSVYESVLRRHLGTPTTDWLKLVRR